MSTRKMITMYLYTRYERFWHWLQMALIFVLLVTGFEVHGTFPFLGFDEAVEVHNAVGLTWLGAFASSFSACLSPLAAAESGNSSNAVLMITS